MIEVTPQEFDFVRASIKSAYPTFNVMPDQYSIRMWYRMLGDLDYKLCETALMELFATHTYPPQISEIREKCAEYTVPLLTDFMAKPLPLSFELIEHTPGFEFDRSPDVAYFDAALLPARLTLRLPRQGDWMVPFGMRGRKKLSDLFSDLKMTRWEKERQWLLCAQEQIIWVVGKRADQRYRVKEETKIILKVKKVEDVAC